MTNCNELSLLRKTLDDLFADILAGKLRLPEVKQRLEEIEREAAPLEWEWDSDHVKHVCEAELDEQFEGFDATTRSERVALAKLKAASRSCTEAEDVLRMVLSLRVDGSESGWRAVLADWADCSSIVRLYWQRRSASVGRRVVLNDSAGAVLSRGPCRVQHCDRCNTVSVAVLHPKCLVLG
jgi:hypothetical protein